MHVIPGKKESTRRAQGQSIGEIFLMTDINAPVKGKASYSEFG